MFLPTFITYFLCSKPFFVQKVFIVYHIYRLFYRNFPRFLFLGSCPHVPLANCLCNITLICRYFSKNSFFASHVILVISKVPVLIISFGVQAFNLTSFFADGIEKCIFGFVRILPTLVAYLCILSGQSKNLLQYLKKPCKIIFGKMLK